MRGNKATAGQPRASESDDRHDPDRRTEIRAKARDIFMRYGYRKTTIEEIGRACGLGKAALYHYFASKEDIFAEVVRVECAKFLTQIRKAIDDAADPKAKLVAMIKTRFRVIGAAMSELIDKQIGAELEELLPLADSAQQDYFRQEMKIIEQILKDGQRQGVFKEVSPAVPLLLIAAMRGIDIHLAAVHDNRSFEETLDSMLTLFFEGLCR